MKVLKVLRWALWPLSLLYVAVTAVRNLLFDYEVGKYCPKRFDTPIISIGNITVGGTGKTPHTEWLIRMLQAEYTLATLSRGYKRKTKGVVVATENSTAADLGDEPMQMHAKFPEVKVVVAEKRVDGVETIQAMPNAPEVILMDDAYQHRYVKPGFSILIVDYNRPLWKDCLLPAGELRELSCGKKRADIIIVSKCPGAISEKEQQYFKQKLKPAKHQQVYFSTISYQKIKPVFDNGSDNIKPEENQVLLLTGIAKPQSIYEYLKPKAKGIEMATFPDHHHFTVNDIEQIRQQYHLLGEKSIIITTEKDAVRLKSILNESDALRGVLYYLPIEIELINNKQEQLKNKIFRYVNENKRSGRVH